jgi:hypothetical protein
MIHRQYSLPDEIEEYRDLRWRREGEGVQTAVQAERFIESVGFVSCLTDSRGLERRSTLRYAVVAMQ